MRICIVSDTHRDRDQLMQAVSSAGDIQAVLHAGDETSDASWLAGRMTCPVYGVAGNWDVPSEAYPAERVITQFGPVVLLTHGHQLQVKTNLDRLAHQAQNKGATIAVFGHTHVAQTAQVQSVLCVNPGSLAEPRGRNVRSYALLSVQSEEQVYVVSVSHHTPAGTLIPETAVQVVLPKQ